MRNLGKSQSHLDGAWASLGKGPAEDMELLKHLDTVSKWTEAREEMAHLPCLSLLCPGLPVSMSLLLPSLIPLKLAKPAVCQACPGPARDPYPFPQPSGAGERVLGKGAFGELQWSGQADQRRPERGQQAGKRMRICKDEGHETDRQTD